MESRPFISQLSRWVAPATALALLPGWAAAQDPVTITGRVTGAQGEPLRDVNVLIFDLGIGVWSGQDGAYRLVVPGARAQGQQVKVTARLIGYRAQSDTVTLVPGTTRELSFRLVSDPLRLDEIVVTGAGTEQQAERLGTARATVDAATLLRANETNVVQALAGKIPNVVTNQVTMIGPADDPSRRSAAWTPITRSGTARAR